MPEALAERQIGDLTVRIDSALCVRFAHCIEESDAAFELEDDQDIVEFKAPEEVEREVLIRACEACPVEALVVLDKDGTQIVP